MSLRQIKANEAPRILIVDDEEMILEAYNDFLDGQDFQVTLTKSPQEAWKILEESRFDLVITDLDMPFLNGEELIEIIRKNVFNRAVPIIIASGNSNKIHESQALRDPSLFLLKKPFTKEELLENIVELFK
ncbi:MAG: two-component system sensor histidine kinase and response regulator WspE [Bacteriovoracaceae bacterium]|jgi:two-component system sensor histidine kinase and response regulator WspE